MYKDYSQHPYEQFQAPLMTTLRGKAHNFIKFGANLLASLRIIDIELTRYVMKHAALIAMPILKIGCDWSKANTNLLKVGEAG